ncbi:MAG: hypothetical protein IRY87_19085 [Acetobacteraceae bacterium]|nr:hypothetical protein [Acetobacteraceae bacterium]
MRLLDPGRWLRVAAPGERLRGRYLAQKEDRRCRFTPDTHGAESALVPLAFPAVALPDA